VLFFTTEVGFGKIGRVTGPEMPSRTDHSSSSTNEVTRFAGTAVLDLTVNECLLLLACAFVKSLAPELEDVFAASVSRKRQTAAQSSVFDVGYRVLHAL